MSQFDLFIHVLRYCWYQHWGQVFLSSKLFCCNDQLIPQSTKLAEIWFSHCELLYQSELFVVIFPENFKFYIQLESSLHQENVPNLSWKLPKSTQLVQVRFSAFFKTLSTFQRGSEQTKYKSIFELKILQTVFFSTTTFLQQSEIFPSEKTNGLLTNELIIYRIHYFDILFSL